MGFNARITEGFCAEVHEWDDISAHHYTAGKERYIEL
jgi:hypothetical protein